MNDEFIIEIPEKVEECAELTIYNRWGQIQYFSTGNDLRWDGEIMLEVKHHLELIFIHFP